MAGNHSDRSSPMTLSELDALVQEYRQRELIIVDPRSWEALVRLMAPHAVVAGTEDNPPLFWFLDKRIVTPQYVSNTMKIAKSHAGIS